MSGTVGISGVASLTGSTNNIGITTSSTILSGSVTQTSGSVLYLDAAATTSAAPPLSWSGDTNTGIYRPAADTLALVTGGTERVRVSSTGALIIGSGDATGTVSGNVLRAPSASGTNIAGGDIEIQAGNGTGTGGSGNIVLKTADVGSSGSTANTLTQRLLITPKGGFSFGSGATSYGTAGQVLISNGDAPPTFGSVITSGTAVSASGTSVTFSGIPSTAKRVTVMGAGISTNGTSAPMLRLSANGTVESTGYAGTTVGNNAGVSAQWSTYIPLYNTAWAATDIITFVVTLTKITENTWTISLSGGRENEAYGIYGAGNKSLSAALDAIYISTITGTTSFDAGTLNILYE
jgi:hypothetical protein